MKRWPTPALGMLDLAVARLVLERARSSDTGTCVKDFLPGSWSRA